MSYRSGFVDDDVVDDAAEDEEGDDDEADDDPTYRGRAVELFRRRYARNTG